MLEFVADNDGRPADLPLREDDLRGFVSAMTCACAQAGTYSDAPLARELFHRVDELQQSPELAAQTLGLLPGDAAYLLAGLREDLARDFVLSLATERPGAGAGNIGGNRI